MTAVGPRRASCPTCRAAVALDPARPDKRFPFCSERCQMVDLGRWLREDYRIAGTPTLESVEAALAVRTEDNE